MITLACKSITLRKYLTLPFLAPTKRAQDFTVEPPFSIFCQNIMPESIKESTLEDFLSRDFDFVIIGGGTAGLAVAARLAENVNIVVGVLESGSSALGEETIDIPGNFGQTIGSEYDWQFETVPQRGLGGRRLDWARGRVLGGTSALNFMSWNRPSKEDLDAWEALGNVGWGWNDLLQVLSGEEPWQLSLSLMQSISPYVQYLANASAFQALLHEIGSLPSPEPTEPAGE